MIWVGRFLGFCFAAIVAYVLAIIVSYGLYQAVGALFVQSEPTYLFSELMATQAFLASQLQELGIPRLQARAYASMLVFYAGLAIVVPVFRMIAGLGWPVRSRWRHVWGGYLWLIGLSLVTTYAVSQGWVTQFEMLGITALIVATLGFTWHVFAQRHAEAWARAKADKAEIDAFA